MNAADLLAAAREVLDRPRAATAGAWPRAVALLTRGALEKTLDEFWESTPATTGLTLCSRRSQFACLPSYLDIGTAREISYVWATLSDACHYHAYELAPTAAELTGWINVVAELMRSIHGDMPVSPVKERSES
jgi:hypothetical protein